MDCRERRNHRSQDVGCQKKRLGFFFFVEKYEGHGGSFIIIFTESQSKAFWSKWSSFNLGEATMIHYIIYPRFVGDIKSSQTRS